MPRRRRSPPARGAERGRRSGSGSTRSAPASRAQRQHGQCCPDQGLPRRPAARSPIPLEGLRRNPCVQRRPVPQRVPPVRPGPDALRHRSSRRRRRLDGLFARHPGRIRRPHPRLPKGERRYDFRDKPRRPSHARRPVHAARRRRRSPTARRRRPGRRKAPLGCGRHDPHFLRRPRQHRRGQRFCRNEGALAGRLQPDAAPTAPPPPRPRRSTFTGTPPRACSAGPRSPRAARSTSISV